MMLLDKRFQEYLIDYAIRFLSEKQKNIVHPVLENSTHQYHSRSIQLLSARLSIEEAFKEIAITGNKPESDKHIAEAIAILQQLQEISDIAA